MNFGNKLEERIKDLESRINLTKKRESILNRRYIDPDEKSR
jgi:hypothetical protein